MIIGNSRRATSPYPVPTTAPYNVPQHLVTPTYDGSGNTVHPGVLDMRRRWHGYRYWMGHTPYPDSSYTYENPSILASNDGLTWVLPAGAPDPLYPPPMTRWNSDTDLSYDPVTDELVMVYRSDTFVPRVARSADGVVWPAAATVVTWTSMGEEAASPALVREDDGTWSMWAVGYPSRRLWCWRGAATPEGVWPAPTLCSGMPTTGWHLDVVRHGGQYLALIADGMETQEPMGVYAASSRDGIAWYRNPTPVLAPGSGGWDGLRLYRSTLAVHDDGLHMRVWYPGKAGSGPADSWHIGLTLIPLPEWPVV